MPSSTPRKGSDSIKNETRKLSPAETARKERFEILCRVLAAEGYEKKDLSIGLVFANVAAIFLMLPFAAVLTVSYFRFNAAAGTIEPIEMLLFLILLLLLAAVHEGIHGLTWGLFAQSHLRAISFGVIWKYLTPYCTCTEPLRRWQYVLGTAMPTLLLGFGLGAASVLWGQPLALLLAVVMLFSGGGDALIILKVLLHRSSGRQAVWCDHPYACGVVVFEKNGQIIADKGA